MKASGANLGDNQSINVAIIAGEESGDLLAADLVAALKTDMSRSVELIGIGGTHLQAHGLKTFFDPDEIALMGISAVLKRLPSLILKINSSAKAIINAKPDILVIVDSPDFTHRVARKVRKAMPDLPIINYVCPSVWAWRPQRAKAMRAYIDHVLCLLPFEVDALKRLDGPQGTYVGHRLTKNEAILGARLQQADNRQKENLPQTLLLLPGSRRSEIKALLPIFEKTVDQLAALGKKPELLLPTLERVEPLVREMTQAWSIKPRIVVGEVERLKALGQARCALAASGTVTLELALVGIPLVSTYKPDFIGTLFRHLISAWSAALPNLIIDRPVVPELYTDMLRPAYIARYLVGLLDDEPTRQAQIQGFQTLYQIMETRERAGEIAAQKVTQFLSD